MPPLIDQPTFEAVQAHLRSRNPKVMPARVVSGPTLLTGICFCARCGGAMTLRTGKSNRYRYYTCSMRMHRLSRSCRLSLNLIENDSSTTVAYTGGCGSARWRHELDVAFAIATKRERSQAWRLDGRADVRVKYGSQER